MAGKHETRRLGARRAPDCVLADASGCKAEPAEKQLIDRHGNTYSAAILRNWSPAALKALGIKPAGGAT